jgi:hypothetical protein
LKELPANEVLEAVQVESKELQNLMNKKGQGDVIETLDYYIIEKVIGKGGFSKVMQVRHKISG